MKRTLLELLSVDEVQKRVLSLLKILGLVTLGSRSYRSATLTPKGEALIKSNLIDMQFISDFRQIFPPGSRGTAGIIQSHMTRFLNENPNFSPSDVLQAARAWVELKGEYCGDAKYFFYKKVEGGEEQRCLEVLESSKDQSTTTNVI